MNSNLDGDSIHHMKYSNNSNSNISSNDNNISNNIMNTPTEVKQSKTSLTELLDDEKMLQYEINRVNSVLFKMKDRGYRLVIMKDGRLGWVNNGF